MNDMVSFWRYSLANHVKEYLMRKKKRLRGGKKTARLCVCAGIIGAGLFLWTADTEEKAHVAPDYPRENIEKYLYKQELSEEDYGQLFRQTGLSGAGVDALRRQGTPEKLLELQENFFGEVKICCRQDSFIAMGERLESGCRGQEIPVVETGDILITFNSHVLGWRSGHAALVIDGEKRLTLEAQVPGTNSEVLSLKRWENYPGFAVLRLKDITPQQQEELAQYAEEQLKGIPYHLTAGLTDKIRLLPDIMQAKAASSQEQAKLSGTHCAHLVWYAYRQLGINLDSDGGMIVTPRDLYESPCLEIVQIYGMEP